MCPIAIFCYNRLSHLQRTVEALQSNEGVGETDLFIFSDGPRQKEDPKVAAVRQYLKTISGFLSVKIIEREENFGLGKSIISGVSEVLKSHEAVIVMEDDLVSSPYFLQFMNEALDRFKDQSQVMSVVGYNYPIDVQESCFFLNMADCLGWATWKDRWDSFESDAESLIQQIESKRLTDRFNIDGSYPYMKLLKKVRTGKNSSWAVRWYASVFLQGGLSLYPGKSLIQHIGNDQGTNMSASDFLTTELTDEPIQIPKKLELKENQAARKKLASYFKKHTSYWGVLLNKLRFYFKRP